ncbi:MAG TPA: hypothetical protein PLU52_07675 [Opitutaceae bacterium]|nr:hypothetical protein [Opitutaceae bacterium]HND62302.1 hypothetical protein [Opitutaceae bacterium]
MLLPVFRPAHSSSCHVLSDTGRGLVRGFTLLALLAAGPVVVRAATPPADVPDPAWVALVRLRTDEAAREFARGNRPERERDFGLAVAQLARQPLTAEQIVAARATFTRLADSGADEVAQASRYLLGRIAQHHLETADPAEAARQYRQLLAEHPDSIWAQTALTRLALLVLYPADPAVTPDAAVAEAEALVDRARIPAARSELHLVIADAIFFYRLPAARALPHLLAADGIGLLDRPTKADTLIQIAEVSVLTGQPAQARKYYEAYLADFPLDQRRFMVRQRLAGL